MPNFITKTLKLLITFLIPVVLVFGSARLLAADAYLAFEYAKDSFPPDPYGFSSQQRFELASTNIHYVRSHLPEDTLANQTLDGKAIYSPRELSHMADVQSVFQNILRVWQAAFILLLCVGFVLWQSGERITFASAMQLGGLLTSGIILTIALLAIFAWQFWFSTFHLFFFQPGSWLFSYSDTLIRLFPVEFWFDATLTISILSLMGGLLIAALAWKWQITIVKSVQKA